MKQEFKFIPITPNEEGARLDRVIRKKFPYLNQASIEKALRNKLLLVNQNKAKSNQRLSLSDFVQIAASLVKEAPIIHKKISHDQIKMVTENIIYRDADLLAINKPAGLAVQGGSKIKTSLDDIMPSMLKTLETWGNVEHKLVHRLDKETSGILLMALNNKTAQELALAFKEHKIEKKYLAIIEGKVTINNGQITSNVNDNEAITNFKVLARRSNATLIEFKPITGRTHQLRIHSLELGFPIFGDYKYNPNAKKNDRLHLHAAEIIVPFKGSKLKLNAPLPEYFDTKIKEIFGKSYVTFFKNK